MKENVGSTPFIFTVGDQQLKDESIVGPKAAGLFSLYKKVGRGLYIPKSFVISAQLYRDLISRSGVLENIKIWAHAHESVDGKTAKKEIVEIRKAIKSIAFTQEEEKQLLTIFQTLRKRGPLMVRSSATIENLPGKSFAGQHDSFANITTKKDFLTVVKQCMASLFTDRAIAYRDTHGFDHKSTAMAVLVQEMVPADDIVSGVMSSFDPDTHFDKVAIVNATYGLGDSLAQGKVVPDKFVLFLEGIKKKKQSIIQKTLGSKEVKTVSRVRKGVKQSPVKASQKNAYCINDEQVVELGKFIAHLKEQYEKPFECEWAWHAKKKQFVMLQIRFHERIEKEHHTIYQYELKRQGTELGRGIAIGHGIASGTVRIINSAQDLAKVKAGDILVAKHTDPAWSQVMKNVHAIITEEGGKTSHAATTARELRVPAIVGMKDARSLLNNRQRVTVQCAAGDNGVLYKGLLPYERQRVEFGKLPDTKTKLSVRMQDPDHAFAWSRLPKDGFGIIDQADIVSHFLRIHPLALLEYTKIQRSKMKTQISQLTRGYTNKRAYAKEKLAEGIARLAVAAYDNPVYIKLSDYRSTQYKDLIGSVHAGSYMRKALSGVDLYNDKAFRKAFALECEAIAMVRNEWGLDNVIPVVPFCRTPEEAKEVLAIMKKNGLQKGKDQLKVHVLCDLPANVVLAEEFAQLFDGMTIQADTLATAALGVGKDVIEGKAQELGAKMLGQFIDDVVKKAHKENTVVQVFGQLLEEQPSFLDAVVKSKVDAIAVHPDALVDVRKRVAMVERTVGRTGQKTHKGFLSLVMVFGILGAGILSVGAGCGVEKNRLPETITQDQVTPAQIREEAMKQVTVALEAREFDYALEKRDLQVSSFAHFSLQYPASWEVNHWNGGVTISHPTSTAYVSIYQPLLKTPLAALSNEQIIIGGKAWTIYDVEHIQVAMFDDNELMIEGTGLGFDDVIETFAFMSDETITDRPLTHWDVREKRLCAQVITFARPAEGEQCQLYPAPCDVPDSWEVCDAEDS